MKEQIKEIMVLIKRKSIVLTLLLSGLIYLGSADVALSQLTGDPTIDPIPVLDLDTSEKSIVVLILFRDGYLPEVQSVEIVPGPNHARAGNPPYLDITLYDLSNSALEKFYSWPPMWLYAAGNPGSEPSVVILTEATGIFGFPFRGDVAKMMVADSKTQSELVSVDLIPGLHSSCRAMPTDPDCTNIVNRLPNCNADGPYSAECTGQTTAVKLDATKSWDIDEDPLLYDWSGPFIGGTATGVKPTVQFQNYGDFSVNLQVSDDFGGQASCSSNVSVIDTTPPVIQCNSPATIIPSDAPISFTATAADSCVGAITANITAFDCFTFTMKGKRIDKKGSCKVAIGGDSITILDSGGINDHITWNISATDPSGNTATLNCEVLVVNKNK